MNPKDLVGAKKAPLGLVPPALEIGAAEALANGAAKYGPYNWREQPVEYMTYLVAMKRHINALIDGQDYAEDTGIHHLHHIVAGGGILIDAKGIPGGLIDNRPPKGPAADMLRAQDRTLYPDVSAGAILAAAAKGEISTEDAMRAVGFDDETIRLARTHKRPDPAAEPPEVEHFSVLIHGMPRDEWDAYGVTENRGNWPPDTRVNGMLTCCGATEHTMECPQWR